MLHCPNRLVLLIGMAWIALGLGSTENSTRKVRSVHSGDRVIIETPSSKLPSPKNTTHPPGGNLGKQREIVVVASDKAAIGVCTNNKAATGGRANKKAATADRLNNGNQKAATADRAKKNTAYAPDPLWMTDYAKAMAKAERQNKMLLIYFCDLCGETACNRFKAETLDHPNVKQKLREYVCLQMPLSAKITVAGKPVTLLEHDAYREMLHRSGIAIVDYRSADPKLRGYVVSTFPITEKLNYTPAQMAVILDLPPGTLTQRTLIYAVRVHPDKPSSTDSEPSPDLLEEARSQSQYQADILRQGHHFWESRFPRIVARLPGGCTAREVCAESWPGENLVEAAIECVRCWRLSGGHWNAVRSPNRVFGYDMQRGGNGVWYATGIFGAR
jgi:hypothetical protein